MKILMPFRRKHFVFNFTKVKKIWFFQFLARQISKIKLIIFKAVTKFQTKNLFALLTLMSHQSSSFIITNNHSSLHSLITNRKINSNHPKSSMKSQQSKNPPKVSYIASALANIQKGCINQKTGQLQIDHGYGDYKMNIFRNKDKLKYYHGQSSIFSDKEFIQNIFDSFHLMPKKNDPITNQNILSVEQLNSPRKAIRQQRARLGTKRQNSLISPRLKEFEIQNVEKNISKDEDADLLKKINQILAKPNDYYLPKNVQNAEDEEQKKKITKGVEQQLRQKQGHLFYRSIPKYMADKWFKNVDNSTPQGNRVIPYVQEPIILPPPKKNHHKRTHIFRFLEKNCKLNNEKLYKSLIFN